MSLEREIAVALNAALKMDNATQSAAKSAAVSGCTESAVTRINGYLVNATSPEEINHLPEITSNISKQKNKPFAVEFFMAIKQQSVSLGTMRVTFNETAKEGIALDFSNSELKSLLLEENQDSVTENRLERIVAEEALHRKLAEKKLAVIKQKEEKTPEELLILAVGDALEFFGKYNNPNRHYPVAPNSAAFMHFPTVPEHYTEAFEAMSKLLDDPKSLENVQALVDIASKVEGHTKWFNILGGIALIALGIALAATFWILPLALGVLTTAVVIVPVMVTLVSLGFGVGMGSMAVCYGRAHSHAAELHKVVDAAEKLQPNQGFFGGLFASPSKEKQANDIPMLEKAVYETPHFKQV